MGAWWASNLLCRNVSVAKSVLWTPLTDINDYPVFNATPQYNPLNQQPHPNNTGTHKVLVTYANEDLIVPQEQHAFQLAAHFRAMPYRLEGGHLYQSNHQAALHYMRDWIEV